MNLMRRLPDRKAPIRVIADEIGLSESRFIHLFKEQVGIPFRRYLLWLRLVEAIELVLDGVSLTTAAHTAGFADSAHLSRTFRRMFGITPSYILKNSQFIQVISCTE
jgi:AraC-like DNA-binding protein